jgi:hypothetical protein
MKNANSSANGRWLKGTPPLNPAGRPLAARQRISEKLLADLANVWEENGESVLRRLTIEEPAKLAQHKAPIIVAKLDRLSRDVQALRACKWVLSTLQRSKSIRPNVMRGQFSKSGVSAPDRCRYSRARRAIHAGKMLGRPDRSYARLGGWLRGCPSGRSKRSFRL